MSKFIVLSTSYVSHIQINNNAILSYIAWHDGKPFIAVLVLWC